MDIDQMDNPSNAASRPLEPEHPMILDGSITPGDVEFMAVCVFEELLQIGTPIEQLRAMTNDQEYQALYGMRLALGPRLDEILDRIHARVGSHRHTTRESNNDVRPATLTVNAPGHHRRPA